MTILFLILLKFIPYINKNSHTYIPIIYISDVFYNKYTIYIKNYIHVELKKDIMHNHDLFINNPIDLTISLKKYKMNYLFKLLVNDYNVVMFNIL